MKHLICSFFVLAIGLQTHAQNLVSNYSFENYSPCPSATSQVNAATGWISSANSPDYFDGCASAGTGVSVPSNICGYQQPASGNGYIGLLAYGSFANYLIPETREYATGTLSAPLVVGTAYKVSFKAVLMNMSSHAVNHLGAKFLTWANPGLLTTNSAQVFTTTVINDTLNWTTIQGTFVADSAYTFISIGNHFSDANTTVANFQPVNFGYNAYYFIDDVTVEIDSSASVPLSTQVSQIDAQCGICNGIATAAPHNGTGPYRYVWSNTDTTQTISALCAGTYTVTVTDAALQVVTASVTVAQTGSIVAAIHTLQSVFCAGDSTQICSDDPYPGYLWNTGAITGCIYAKAAGNYYLTVTDNNGCTAESNHVAITVYPQPPVSISVNGDTLTSYNAVTYQWYLNGSEINGATSAIYILNQGGSYTVAITDTNGCMATSNAIVISGIESLTGSQFSISPNPFTSNISIALQKQNIQQATFTVTNVLGQSVYTSHENNLSNSVIKTIDLSYLSRGVYFLEVIANGERSVKELVKQ